MKSGVELIAEERTRQIEVEGWSASRDARHIHGELASAASVYAMPRRIRRDLNLVGGAWPWDIQWFKPCPQARVRELQKAGALIAAEIDRLLVLTANDNEV